jgi:hypothetical protein
VACSLELQAGYTYVIFTSCDHVVGQTSLLLRDPAGLEVAFNDGASFCPGEGASLLEYRLECGVYGDSARFTLQQDCLRGTACAGQVLVEYNTKEPPLDCHPRPPSPPPRPPLPPTGGAYALTNPIPVGCPNGAPGVTPASIGCPAVPSNANGGMLFDLTSLAPPGVQVTIRSLAVLTPFVEAGGWTGSAPVTMLVRRRSAATCLPGLVCTGSVRDNQFWLNGSFADGASSKVSGPGAPACVLKDPSWTSFVTGTVQGNGTIEAVVGAVTPISLAPGEVVGVWIRFISGSQMARPTDASLVELGTGATDNAPGDPTFSYVEQGYLRLSAGMQAKAPDAPNWANMRPFVGSFGYMV